MDYQLKGLRSDNTGDIINFVDYFLYFHLIRRATELMFIELLLGELHLQLATAGTIVSSLHTPLRFAGSRAPGSEERLLIRHKFSAYRPR